MYSGKNKHKNITALCLILIVSLPLTVVASEEHDLEEAKATFTDVWHSAAETTKRRSELEQNLAQFDTKVATAKKDLESARENRKQVREKIAERKTLIDTLTAQMTAVQEAKGFYLSVASNSSNDVANFVRYIALKDIAFQETGPVFGGDITRLLLRGSLGDSIDTQLAHLAVLKARNQLVGRVSTLITEATNTDARLHAVAADLSKELAALEEEQRKLSNAESQTTAFIDTSWKQKALNEQELKAVAAEANEASQRVADLQQDLIKINEELKGRKLDGIKDQLKALQKERADLEENREALKRKDEAMRLAEEAELKAFQATVTQRNTDKKQYKYIQDRELELKDLLSTLSGGIIRIDGRDEGAREMTAAERVSYEAKVEFLKEQIKLMKDGVPNDIAAAYLKAKKTGDEATKTRAILEKEIAATAPKLADVLKRESTLAEEVDKVERETALGDLPPVFIWPVKGPITAGFFDDDYKRVFGVPHRAIDIAIPQSSAVHAVSDGIVFAVRDGGATGYSYILIGHRNGYSSLYGHVSAALVKKGDMVLPGQIIALSGGIPGTHGAGHMTTGAHLHLEITKNGVHIDPRSVLPAR